MNQKINDKGDRVSHSRFNTRAQMSRSNFQLMIAEIQDPIFDGLSDICVQFLKGSSDMCARARADLHNISPSLSNSFLGFDKSHGLLL